MNTTNRDNSPAARATLVALRAWLPVFSSDSPSSDPRPHPVTPPPHPATLATFSKVEPTTPSVLLDHVPASWSCRTVRRNKYMLQAVRWPPSANSFRYWTVWLKVSINLFVCGWYADVIHNVLYPTGSAPHASLVLLTYSLPWFEMEICGTSKPFECKVQHQYIYTLHATRFTGIWLWKWTL